jgi:cation diffusion facilitator family transporter
VNSRLQRGLRLTLIGMAVNIALAIGKMIAGVVGHSHALIADGVESLADIISSLVVWRGMVVAAAPADDGHPYGHGKAEPIAAAVVAGLLIIAAGWIAVQAVLEILRPHSLPKPFTLAVLIGVIVIKESLFRWVLKGGQELQSTAIHSDAWHHRSDAITSFFCGVGIAIAIIGGPGYEAADDVAAFLAAGVIAWNGYRLLRGSFHELMDPAPEVNLVKRIHEIAAQTPEVAGVEKCRVRKSGYQHFVELHLEVDPQMNVNRAHDLAHQVKDAVRAELPQVSDVLVHIEPAGRNGR